MTARVGSGHTAAADAVRSALAAHGVESEVADSYRYAATVFSRVVSEGYIGMVRTIPKLYGIIYDRAEAVKEANGFRVWASEFTARNIARLVRRIKPRAVVCTHAFPCGVMSAYKRLVDPSIHVMGVVTDFVVHPFWIYRNIDAYAVATTEMRDHLIARGIEAARISVDGIPVAAAFGEPADRNTLRAALGVPLDQPLVLVMGGGLGLGPVAAATAALANDERTLTIVVMVGSNRALARRVDDIARYSRNAVRALGYVDTVADWMRAADVLVTKPGGLTSSEALAAEVPMVMLRPLPGQEERNARLFVRYGAALAAEKTSEVPQRVGQVLDNAELRTRMMTAMTLLRRPQSAETIARRLLTESALQ